MNTPIEAMPLSISARMEMSEFHFSEVEQAFFVRILLDGEYFHTAKVTLESAKSRHPFFSKWSLARKILVLEGMVLSDIFKQWEVKCDPTLIMEVKSQKTITSSCGQLRVTESPSLMVTCSPTL